MTTPISWNPPGTFNPETPGLGLPPLEGVAHTLLYDPLPSRCELDYGGTGRYESLRHGTSSHAMPVAGELPDGRPWIICNNQSRRDMYLALSNDGRTFDSTWLLMHNPRMVSDDGMHKGGGPQYFQAVTVGGNIWVVYSITKEQVGISRISISLLTR
jgi:hypothetical protein